MVLLFVETCHWNWTLNHFVVAGESFARGFVSRIMGRNGGNWRSVCNEFLIYV